MGWSHYALIAVPLTFVAVVAPYIYITMFNTFKNLVTSEKIPAAIKSMSFYDLKATLPGKDRVMDFVSGDNTTWRRSGEEQHGGLSNTLRSAA